MRRSALSIVRRALEEPLRQIAENAGMEGSVVVERIKHEKKGIGFNAATDEYVDMVKAGIVDPVKVTRSRSGKCGQHRIVDSDDREPDRREARAQGLRPGYARRHGRLRYVVDYNRPEPPSSGLVCCGNDWLNQTHESGRSRVPAAEPKPRNGTEAPKFVIPSDPELDSGEESAFSFRTVLDTHALVSGLWLHCRSRPDDRPLAAAVDGGLVPAQAAEDTNGPIKAARRDPKPAWASAVTMIGMPLRRHPLTIMGEG